MKTRVLNDMRLRETRQIFIKYGISLPEHEIETYSNVFEICSRFIHGKLTTEEIFKAYDLLSDVMKNDRPDLAVHVDKDDRIRVAVRLMEELSETKGRLTMDEKSAFVYCIMTGECTQVYDEEKDTIFNGVVLFDSFEHIESSYSYEKEEFPDKFKVEITSPKRPGDTYGFSVENAIETTSVGAAYCYLDGLRYHGKPVQYDRIGSFPGPDGHLVDGYEISVFNSWLLKKKQVKICTLYINAYCSEMSDFAPKGFTLT